MTRDHVIVTWAAGDGLRTTAIALYERLGFIVTESWDSRNAWSAWSTPSAARRSVTTGERRDSEHATAEHTAPRQGRQRHGRASGATAKAQRDDMGAA
ncbi:hypothetical protein [Microbispora rosea]|uniref:hypothetical protein n=1 Tax=Microbispora rosea TaxID=58117 RepID=UPI003D94B681